MHNGGNGGPGGPQDRFRGRVPGPIPILSGGRPTNTVRVQDATLDQLVGPVAEILGSNASLVLTMVTTNVQVRALSEVAQRILLENGIEELRERTIAEQQAPPAGGDSDGNPQPE